MYYRLGTLILDTKFWKVYKKLTKILKKDSLTYKSTFLCPHEAYRFLKGK